MVSFRGCAPYAAGRSVVSDLLESAIEQARALNKTLPITPGTITLKANRRLNNDNGRGNIDAAPV